MKILETAIERCFLQKDDDFIEEIGEKTVTHWRERYKPNYLFPGSPALLFRLAACRLRRRHA